MLIFAMDDEVQLRQLVPSDAEAMFRLIEESRWQLREWLPWVDQTVSVKDASSFIEGALQLLRRNAGVSMGIHWRGQLAGVISLQGTDWIHRSVSVGYWLGIPYQGLGIMTRSCQALIHYAFSTLGLHRIEIRAGVRNGKSRAIPERLGFSFEGIAREAERHADGYIDLAVYSLLATEWWGMAPMRAQAFG